MKELLSIKEKAHRYDKALRVVEKLHRSWKETQNRAANEIEEAFPELRESEDENIKQYLISFIKLESGVNLSPDDAGKILSWVEKQGSNLVENGYTNNKDIIKYADNYSHAIWHKLMDNFKNIKDYHIGCNDVSDIVLNAIIDAYNWLEKQGEQKSQGKPALDVWKDMRFEAYQQASGNRHEPNYSDDSTKMFSLTDIDEIFEKVAEKQDEQKQNPCEDCNHAMLNCSNFPCEEKKRYNDEQKPTESPKFKVGDKIIRKEFGGDFIHNPHKIIQVDILDKKYRLEGGLDAHFLEEDDWELVEQEPADKFEPKFNVGDWLVCCNYEPEQIVGIRNDMYEMSNGDIRPIKMINKNHNIRLWTIEDAKDGDVLREDSCTFIIERMKPDGTATIHCCLFDDGDFELGSNLIFDVYSTYPATKEQRDLLFSKMKEAGYEWDAEKKELKKIEQAPAPYFYCKYGGTIPKCSGCIRNHLNSKYKTEEIKTWMTPASRGTKQCSDYVPKDSVKWSEEDEKMLDSFLHKLEVCDLLSNKEIVWIKNKFKSLKERVQQQPKWSETAG